MKIRRKQRETRTHAAKWLLLVAAVALCFVAYQGVQGVLHVMRDWTNDLPSLASTDAFNYAQESTMYAGDNSTLLAEFQLEKRDPLTSADQVSPYVLKGTVDTEDVRFYEHTGVDLPGIARAVLVNIGGGALEGASTITQQLMRNTVLSEEATDISFERKIREAQLAIDFEKMHTKDEILLMYLNTINYGDGCYGIEAAAQNYFQVSALDLTLAQAATLVGIPQSPTYLNPKTNPEACQTRRNVVLDRMLTAGDITKEEHDAAQSEELGLNPAPDAPADGIYAYPYFTSYVRNLLLNHGADYNMSDGDLFEGGYTIYTTLDPAMQNMAEEACATQRARMDEDLDASLVALEPSTGHIKAMVGGKDFYENQANIATGEGGTGRQAGSTFKAFALGAAIEDGINPKTLIDCTGPMTLTDGTRIENFDNANYGIRSIQSATAVSSNTGYIRLTEQLTPGKVINMAQRAGITSDLPNVLAVTTGSGSVTPLEMASAYGTFATGGVKHNPVAISKIVKKSGEVVYEASDEGERVMSEEVAGAETKVLRTVFETSEGTAYGKGPHNGQPVAGKTGTSDDFADHWLVGYAPQLVCSTWIGNPSGHIETDRYLNCNDLWQDFMSQALEGTEIVPFPETKDPEYKNAFNTEQKKKYEKEEEKDASKAPNVVGKTLDEATGLLSGYNAYAAYEYSDTVPANVVMSQAVQGSNIILTVSKGPKPADPTPDPTPTPDTGT
ncbi:glycosyl transferase [Gordonibacter massiliensis]|nr:glycosyl transferase [Gordonibacter massiliensis (ex Traore et al. 2017)]